MIEVTGTIEERRALITETLKKGIFEVVFTKVDGSLREMPCTLLESLLPPTPVTESGTEPKVKKVNPEVMGVFCTDKQAWRSFRLENVLRIRATTPE
jgi:hypothetical protein